jgi:UDP-N-acetylmuramate--alanine ligase
MKDQLIRHQGAAVAAGLVREHTRQTMRLPRETGPIHFVGIGGIGMSGIAEVLVNLGYTVQGSDASENANVARLRGHGVKVSVGHRPENVDGAEVVVVSTAIKRDNPELMAARARRIPVVRRAEMLAELMRLKSCVAISGTHGKTTTTSMVATLLDAGGLDPTVVNGGIINAYGTNARLGAGDWMVVEADESDGTFLKLPADIAIVTNVDPEHLDHFKTFDAVQDAFRNFVENVPFYGFAVMCIDHPIVQSLVGKIEDRRIITYGENPQADARLVGLSSGGGSSQFAVAIRDRNTGATHEIKDVVLPMPGRHNASNATAAIAVAHELGVSDDAIRKAIASFGGVKRRFTKTGDWNGVTIIDDYGHHPVEIAAVLKAARDSYDGRVIAVVQPHRYTRLQSLFEEFCSCFNDADAVIVADVYPAGEAPIEGIDRDHFVQGLRSHGHREVIALPKAADLAGIVKGLAKPGDLVVCLGAGNITQWAYALPGELKALR